MKSICAFPGCERPYYGKGLCQAHWRQRRYGKRGLRELHPPPGERNPNGDKRCTKCKCWMPEGRFHRAAKTLDGLASHCKDCVKEYRSSNLQRIRERDRSRRHGIPPEDFDALFDSQGHACAICRRTESIGKGWVVDHDHECCPSKGSCGKCVRGILCANCNAGIGLLGDSPSTLAAAIGYLDRAKVTEVLS